MSEKIYYYIKLEEQYFGSKMQKAIRKQAGGTDMLICYLKMQLRYAKDNGYIKYDKLYPTPYEEIANDIDEEPEIVLATVNFLAKFGYFEQVNKELFYLPEMQVRIGSKTDAAKRMEKHRALKGNVTKLQGSYIDETKSDAILEIELEKEIELDITPTETPIDPSPNGESPKEEQGNLPNPTFKAKNTFSTQYRLALINKCFVKFYSLYPNKKGNGKANESYVKAFKECKEEQEIIDLAMTVLKGLKGATSEWEAKKTEKQYIPHPATWLNQKRWNDEYEESSKVDMPRYAN